MTKEQQDKKMLLDFFARITIAAVIAIACVGISMIIAITIFASQTI